MLVETAPAKVNLALHVVGRRPDGYHLLESLVIFPRIGDVLTARPAETDALTVRGPFASGLEAGEANLVNRAVAAFRRRWPEELPAGVSIELTKNLPVASGIGGGSADAAATLRLLARLSGKERTPDARAEVALGLGADVPVCLFGRPCIVRGVGEAVTPLARFPECHLVLANPLVPVETPDVFRRLERRDNPPLPPFPEPLRDAEELGAWLEETRNDLYGPAAAQVPAIAALVERLSASEGCFLARMSGSGATVFGLFASDQDARGAAHLLAAERADCWVAAGPVIGPAPKVQ